jgi:hypothetical protein
MGRQNFGNQAKGAQDAEQSRDLAGLRLLLGFLSRAVEDGAQIAVTKPWIKNSPRLIASSSAASSLATGLKARTEPAYAG